MTWRVVATREGFYNQVLRGAGEVFDLLCYQDGTYPPALKYTAKLDAAGKPIPDEWNEEIVLGRDKKTPVHRDFAEDQGEKLIRKGPIKGDVMRFGWMKRVPDRIPIGLYPEGSDFWGASPPHPVMNQMTGLPYQPVPPVNERAPEDRRRNHARILEHLPPESIEAA